MTELLHAARVAEMASSAADTEVSGALEELRESNRHATAGGTINSCAGWRRATSADGGELAAAASGRGDGQTATDRNVQYLKSLYRCIVVGRAVLD